MGKKDKHKNREGVNNFENVEESFDENIDTKNVQQEKVKEVVDTTLEEEKAVVFEKKELVYEPGYYGKEVGDRLELAMVEAVLLLKRGRIRVLKNGQPMTVEQLYTHACSLDKRFPHKYRVYEDLRERGLLVRTGYKFGCDFRVYERGVQLKKGPKSAKEHTKWIVFAVPEDFTCSFQELSRAVRLAHNIRARMLWAIVDNEADVTFLQITRHKP